MVEDIDYGKVIGELYQKHSADSFRGKVADYIPALADVDPSRFGICVRCADGNSFSVGDASEPFSIQSISKVFTLAMVAGKIGEDIWKFVGREPSGTAFNSLVQLEYEQGIPRNPFINAGALAVTDRLMNLYTHPKDAILEFMRSITGNDDIYYDKRIAKSEMEHADRNMALCHLMKSFGNIVNDVEDVLDVYCHQCAILMSCEDLAKATLLFALRGVNPVTGERLLTVSQAKRIGALMLTCGFYDESGDFAFRAGLPGKSGVGGGIAAYIPGQLAITVWSPGLNAHGNSLVGTNVLEDFTTLIGNSIF